MTRPRLLVHCHILHTGTGHRSIDHLEKMEIFQVHILLQDSTMPSRHIGTRESSSGELVWTVEGAGAGLSVGRLPGIEKGVCVGRCVGGSVNGADGTGRGTDIVVGR